MHHLRRMQLIARHDGTSVGVMAQIAVAVAKGIRHFGDYSDKRAVTTPCQPEADRIENMTENTRLRQKLDPRNVRDLIVRQHVTRPCGTGSMSGCATVIPIPKRRYTAPVSGKQQRRLHLRLGVQ